MNNDKETIPSDINALVKKASITALFQQAVSLFHQGHLDDAEALLQQILTQAPNSADANHLLGIIAMEHGQDDLACQLFNRAIGCNPQEAVYYANLAYALQRGGRLEAALVAYERSIELNPEDAEVHTSHAVVLKDLGRLQEALAACERSIQLDPDYAGAQNIRGNVLRLLGRFDAALDAYEKAMQFNPAFAEARANCGIVLRELGRLEEARVSCEQAIRLNPDFAGAHNMLGTVLCDLGYLEKARAACERAIELDPAYAEAHNIHGNVLRDMGLPLESEVSYRRALELQPAYAQAHSNLLFLLVGQAHLPPDSMLDELRRWDRVHGQAGRLCPVAVHARETLSGRRLRVGYVSSDLYAHVVSHFFEPLLVAHDRSTFEIFCYDTNEKAPDVTTERLRGLAEHWRRVGDTTDAELASLIHADGIDILVDLAGHTGGNRLKAFTYRPAPVQATYLGYFASTGLEAMDYWITDAVLHPADTTEPSVERIVRLPRCWVCYQPPAEAPPVSPCPNTDERVVFGSFCNLSKLNPAVIRTWAELLRRLPGSRLLLMDKPLVEVQTRQRLAERFAQEGISAEQLMLRAGVPYIQYLSTYAEIDIVLDPFPRTGGTVTAEALWMGVPVVTLAGRYYVERISASKLTALGLEDLITRSQEEYLDRAVSLARDPAGRMELRLGLRERMRQSPLCDGAGLASAMEDAYRMMWERYVSRAG